ncbi:phosphatase PAP2 family protein [Chloroflexota bacterium]
MDYLLQWGIDLIIAIQQVHGPVLDSVFRAITSVGGEEFYLLFIPLFYWCIDLGMGARLAILLLISSWLNINLKDLLQHPRPFDLDQTVMLSSVGGYGLPSNHAQAAVVLWGSIAFWGHKTWLWVIAIALTILIGFSRVYLGVHFPTDVLAGWAIGIILLGIYLSGNLSISKILLRLNLWQQILLALVLPVALLLIHPVNSTTSAMGTLAGAGLGLALMHRYVHFKAGGLWFYRVLRFIIGSIVVFAIYMGLSTFYPGEESAFYLVFRYLHYGLIGLWVSLGAPWLFLKLKLN